MDYLPIKGTSNGNVLFNNIVSFGLSTTLAFSSIETLNNTKKLFDLRG